MTRANPGYCARGHSLSDNPFIYDNRHGKRLACRICRYWLDLRTRGLKLTYAEFDVLRQVERCEICGVKLTAQTREFDHDHSTGKVRGVLCSYCNTGLGRFKDDPKLLVLAAKYLETKRSGK